MYNKNELIICFVMMNYVFCHKEKRIPVILFKCLCLFYTPWFFQTFVDRIFNHPPIDLGPYINYAPIDHN